MNNNKTVNHIVRITHSTIKNWMVVRSHLKGVIDATRKKCMHQLLTEGDEHELFDFRRVYIQYERCGEQGVRRLATHISIDFGKCMEWILATGWIVYMQWNGGFVNRNHTCIWSRRRRSDWDEWLNWVWEWASNTKRTSMKLATMKTEVTVNRPLLLWKIPEKWARKWLKASKLHRMVSIASWSRNDENNVNADALCNNELLQRTRDIQSKLM